MQTKSLILLRGLPGSGKSTLAEVLSEEGKYPVYSIDSFFTNQETGEYNFEFDKNYLAYRKCEEDTQSAMENQKLLSTIPLRWIGKLNPIFNWHQNIITGCLYSRLKNTILKITFMESVRSKFRRWRKNTK